MVKEEYGTEQRPLRMATARASRQNLMAWLPDCSAYEMMRVSWFSICSSFYRVFWVTSRFHLPVVFKWYKEKGCVGDTSLCCMPDTEPACDEVWPHVVGVEMPGQRLHSWLQGFLLCNTGRRMQETPPVTPTCSHLL